MSRPAAVNLPTPLLPVLALTAVASVSTGVIWSGIFFIAEQAFGYTPVQNLLLSIVTGSIYAVSAFSAGRVTAIACRRMTPRALIGWALVVQSLVALLPLVIHTSAVLWVVSCVTMLTAALFWPVVESYLTAGRHGAEMRFALGIWNVVWTGAVAFSLLIIAPLLEDHALMAIVMLSVLNAAGLVTLIWFRRRPGEHDHERHQASITPEYPDLLRAARVLLPLSYVLAQAMSPLLPYILERLAVPIIWKTPATATWMIARVVTMLTMWRLRFWHGRWGTILFAGLSMTIGFAIIVTAASVAAVLAGFALFGVGLGVAYYAAIYYAMAVGRGEVGAGGTHEALIGLGYAVGPAAGLAGVMLGGSGWVVGIVWSLIAVGSVPAVRPYLAARRRRRSRPERAGG